METITVSVKIPEKENVVFDGKCFTVDQLISQLKYLKRRKIISGTDTLLFGVADDRNEMHPVMIGSTCVPRIGVKDFPEKVGMIFFSK